MNLSEAAQSGRPFRREHPDWARHIWIRFDNDAIRLAYTDKHNTPFLPNFEDLTSDDWVIQPAPRDWTLQKCVDGTWAAYEGRPQTKDCSGGEIVHVREVL